MRPKKRFFDGESYLNWRDCRDLNCASISYLEEKELKKVKDDENNKKSKNVSDADNQQGSR